MHSHADVMHGEVLILDVEVHVAVSRYTYFSPRETLSDIRPSVRRCWIVWARRKPQRLDAVPILAFESGLAPS